MWHVKRQALIAFCQQVYQIVDPYPGVADHRHVACDMIHILRQTSHVESDVVAARHIAHTHPCPTSPRNHRAPLGVQFRQRSGQLQRVCRADDLAGQKPVNLEI